MSYNINLSACITGASVWSNYFMYVDTTAGSNAIPCDFVSIYITTRVTLPTMHFSGFLSSGYHTITVSGFTTNPLATSYITVATGINTFEKNDTWNTSIVRNF